MRLVWSRQLVDIVTEIDEVEQAVGRDLVPDRVALICLAEGLTWVQILRFIDLFVGLWEHREHISNEIDDWNHVSADFDSDFRFETWDLNFLLLVKEGKDQFDHDTSEFGDKGVFFFHGELDVGGGSGDFWNIMINQEWLRLRWQDE